MRGLILRKTTGGIRYSPLTLMRSECPMIRTIRNSLLALSGLAGLAANSQAQFLPSPLGIPVAPYRYFYGQVNVNNLGQNYSLGYIRTTPLGNRYTYLPSVGYNPVYASQSKAMRDARKQEFPNELPTRRELTANVNDPRIDRNPNELFEGKRSVQHCTGNRCGQFLLFGYEP